MGLTADRIARKKSRPAPIKVPRTVPAGTRIFANSLVGVRAADGMAVPLPDAPAPAAYSQVLYAADGVDATADGPRGAVDTRAVFLRDVTVELAGVALGQDDEGKAAYATSDFEVDSVEAAGASIEIGRIEVVTSADRAFVHVA